MQTFWAGMGQKPVFRHTGLRIKEFHHFLKESICTTVGRIWGPLIDFTPAILTLANTLHSVSMDLFILDIACKLNHTVYDLLFMTSLI